MSNRTARRTHGFTESVIRGMTRLATEHGAINLAQGFPNFPCPDVLKEAAARAIRDNMNQYAVTWGAARLRNALAAKCGFVDDPAARMLTCGLSALSIGDHVTDRPSDLRTIAIASMSRSMASVS